MLKSYCYNHLTKKYKIMGISYNSLMILLFALVFFWFIIKLWAIPLAIILSSICAIMEYIDEDIFTILDRKLKIKSKKYYS
ncbi:hypothetical protein FTT16_08390 [Campylobacter jejuni]|nr:hypothetical protein [Campylobacter jejuni]